MSDDTPSLSRRRILKAVGVGGTAALAGCKDVPQSVGTGGSETPTGTPTETETPGGGNERCPDAEYVLNTGYDQDAGTPITPCTPDDDWEVTDEEVSAGVVPRQADVIDPNPAWATPFPDSRWISVTCDGDPGLSSSEELFEFTYCFCLNEGFHEPELDLKLRADDAIEEIRLNGNSLPFSGNGTYAGTPVDETYGKRYRRYFQPGENCLTVVIRDTGSVITGLNLVGTVTAKNGECCSGDCDLGIEKTHEGPFEFGGTGTYVVEVCNEGDGRCERAAKVRDELPPAVTLDTATGQGWNVTSNGGKVEATHPNQSGLAPGDCLPPLKIHVDVAPLEEFPDGKAVSNCAELLGGGQHGDNDRDCTTPCVVGERTFEGGVHDDFDPSNSEPATPSDGLMTRNQPGVRGFDEGGVNKAFGHTFDGLRPPAAGEICEAKLEICLRPEGSSLDVNDRINLGVWDDDGNGIDTHWSRHLGNYDGKPGIFDTRWHAEWGSTAEPRCITLDLTELPEEDGSTTNLLPVLNAHDRLGVRVQDDTAVDFAHLTVTYCCDDGEDDGDDGGSGGDTGDDAHCDLSIAKHVEEPFEFGGHGVYRFHVCNRGDAACENEVFEIADDLPDGFRFVDGRGQGWRFDHADRERNRVVARYEGATLGPDECLPPVLIRVEAPSEDRWPHETNRVQNCVKLTTGGEQADEDCIEHRVR